MNRPNNLNYYEVEFSFRDPAQGTYSICIRGTREPSVEEAAVFCRKDAESLDAVVTRVDPISREEAEHFYDFSNEENWPIFCG